MQSVELGHSSRYKQTIEVGHTYRLNASELVFKGSAPDGYTDGFRERFGTESIMHRFNKRSITAITWSSIKKCDNEMFPDLMSNVVLSGGNTMLKEFPSRLQAELEMCCNKDDSAGSAMVEVVAEPYRYHAAWVGGSMLASLDEFAKNITITRAGYEDKNKEMIQK